MLVMIPEYDHGNTSPVSKDSDEVSFTRTRLYTPTSSTDSTDSECEFEALSEGLPEPEYTNDSSSSGSNEAENAIENTNRQVIINKATDPIYGIYPLLDNLSLSTTTGSIDVIIDVNQDPALLAHSQQPARVIISSDTGNIRVSFQGGNHHEHRSEHGHGDRHGMNITPRNIEVDIGTGTGNIEGTVPFTTSLSLRTISGCIRTVLVPIIVDVVPVPVPSILTTSGTGSQSVCVAEPVMLGQRYGLGQGTASHISSEGSLNIRYPTTWAGWVELRGGSNFMAGEGIDRVHSGDGCVRGVKRKRSNDIELGISLQTRGSAMFTVG